jgi:phage baseplate assembly protein W
MSLRPSREIAFPFHIGPHGGVAFVEDRYKTYFQHIVVTLLTRLGERLMVPGFGSPVQDYVFENEDLSAEMVIFVRQALERWEPGVVIHDIVPAMDEWEPGKLLVTIEFSVPPRQDVLSTTIDVGGVVAAGGPSV